MWLTLLTAALTAVTDGGLETPDAGVVDENAPTVVVTASRGAQRRSDSTTPTEVITRRQVLEVGARDVGEALQARPGIEVYPNVGGLGVRMQGLGPEYSLLLVDGQRATGRINGAVDVSRYSVEDLEQLEVVKGPASVMWGSDALAGVIHLVTRRPQKPFGFGVLASYGVFNQLDARGSVETAQQGWGLRGSVAVQRRDAYDLDPSTPSTNGSAYDSVQGSTRVTFGDPKSDKVSGDVRGALLYRYQHGVDSNATGAVFDRLSQDWLAEVSSGVKVALPKGVLGFSAGVNLWQRRFVLDQQRSSAFDSVEDSADRNALVTGSYSVGLGNHALIAGIDLLGESFVSQRIVGGSSLRGRGSLFVQDEWRPLESPRIALVGGVRLDLDSRFGPVVTPRLAVRIDPVPTLALRLSAGSGFRAPSFQELFLDFENPSVGYVVRGTPGLRPERSLGLTASLDWQLHSALTLSVSGYWNELFDMIAYDTNTLGEMLEFRYANLGRARTRGGEVALSWRPHRVLSFEVGYALNDARDLTTSQPLEGQASHRGVSQVRLFVREWGLTVVVRGALTSGRPFSESSGGTRYSAPFLTLDARAAKTIIAGLEVFVTGTNLAGAGNALDLPIPPRAVFAGASYTY